MRQTPKEIIQKAKESDLRLQITKLKSELQDSKKQYKQVVRINDELEKQLGILVGLQEHQPEHPVKLTGRSVQGKRKCAIILPACDWHVGEVVDGESVNYKNHYNRGIAHKRITKYYSKVIELINWYRKLAPIGEIWHPLLGDLTTGNIHDDLRESNDMTATEGVAFLQDMLVYGIDLLRKETKLDIHIPTVTGNHGRCTEKPRIKTDYKNSYEQLLYWSLRKIYQKNTKVHFYIANGFHNIQTIAGRKIRFLHGHLIGYRSGIGGISIPVNKAIKEWNEQTQCDLTILGHFHTFNVNYPTWISCGSLMGYSAFSLAVVKAGFQHPTQTFIVIDPAYGLTAALPIFVEEPKRR